MINNFASLFFDEYDEDVKETFYTYENKISSSNIMLPSKDHIQEAFSFFPSKDDVIISLFIEESDLIPLSKENLDKDLEEIQHALSFEDKLEKVTMKISIIKKTENKTVSIYSFNHFFK